jgi:hypothetical protein
MACDWIKMRIDIYDDPAVIAIALSTGLDQDAVVGKLHRLWSWADKHTKDGKTPGIVKEWVDRYVGKQGFADAMIRAGWLYADESGIELPNFERHNGHTAKQRGDAQIRQRLSRANRDNHVTGTKRTSMPAPFVRFVMKRDAYICVYCGTESSYTREFKSSHKLLTVDHIVPASRGGKTSVENLVTCCRQCNMEKSDRTPEEWDIVPQFLQDGVSYSGHEIVTALSQEKVTSSLLFSYSSLMSTGKIPEQLKGDRFEKSWDSWVSHRLEIKHPLHTTMVDAQLKMLGEKGLDRACQMLDHTVSMGWQGLREPDEKVRGKPVAPTETPDEKAARLGKLWEEQDRAAGRL